MSFVSVEAERETRIGEKQVDIAAWLTGIGLEQYKQAFDDNEIDAELLPRLTADDLKDMGIVAVGHRRKLLIAIAELQARPDGAPAAAAAAEPTRQRAAETARQPDAERRQLTVLFCDLVGSTVLGARLDPEDLREVIAAYHGCVTTEVNRFGGFVAKYMGDGVLVYFGYPTAQETHAEHAVRAGLSVVEAVARLHTMAGPPGKLASRVGIATGMVVVGDLIGAGASREEAVVGDTPNLAARMQAMAEPNTVMIAGATQRLTAGLFEYRDLGAVAVRGYDAPIRAWQVLREFVDRQPVRGAAHPWRHSAVWPGGGALAAPAPLGAGAQGRRPRGVANRRRGHRQVAPLPHWTSSCATTLNYASAGSARRITRTARCIRSFRR